MVVIPVTILQVAVLLLVLIPVLEVLHIIGQVEAHQVE